MSRMRGILIDPVARTVAVVKFESNFPAIERMLGCDVMTTCRVAVDAMLLLDDTGANTGKPHFMLLDTPNRFGYPAPLHGKALLFGLHGPEGEMTDCPYRVEYVRSITRFPLSTLVREATA